MNEKKIQVNKKQTLFLSHASVSSPPFFTPVIPPLFGILSVIKKNNCTGDV